MEDKTIPEYLLELCRKAKDAISEDDPPFNVLNSGLCALLSSADDDSLWPPAAWHLVAEYKDELMRRWPEAVGNTYPVGVSWHALTRDEQAGLDDGVDQCSSDGQVARALFDAVDACVLYEGNFWDRDTEYGRARWRLLDWMIEELEKELEK